jgi:hypothetical protein
VYSKAVLGISPEDPLHEKSYLEVWNPSGNVMPRTTLPLGSGPRFESPHGPSNFFYCLHSAPPQDWWEDIQEPIVFQPEVEEVPGRPFNLTHPQTF